MHQGEPRWIRICLLLVAWETEKWKGLFSSQGCLTTKYICQRLKGKVWYTTLAAVSLGIRALMNGWCDFAKSIMQWKALCQSPLAGLMPQPNQASNTGIPWETHTSCARRSTSSNWQWVHIVAHPGFLACSQWPARFPGNSEESI